MTYVHLLCVIGGFVAKVVIETLIEQITTKKYKNFLSRRGTRDPS